MLHFPFIVVNFIFYLCIADLHPESELESTAEVGEIGISDYALGVDGLDASLNGEAIQLVEDIFEEFGDEEEREFS